MTIILRRRLDVLDPMFTNILPKMDSRQARVMLIAIGLQESRLIHRVQITNSGKPGPARGLWQFERGGGVVGVLTHASSKSYALLACAKRQVKPTALEVWNRLAIDDILAAACARLLLWTDAALLPVIGDEAGAWSYYLRCWRPGKPHISSWAQNYQDAVQETP